MTLRLIYFFELDEGGRRGHSKKLFKRRCRLDVRQFVYGNRIVDKWNCFFLIVVLTVVH